MISVYPPDSGESNGGEVEHEETTRMIEWFLEFRAR